MIYKIVQTVGVSNIRYNLTLLFSKDVLNCIKDINICTKKKSNKSVI